MADIALVDVSLRDGNQSLWGATGLRTAHVAQVAPLLNRVGFRALDYSSSTAMGVSVRVHRENPWELLRLTRAAIPDTRLQFIGTGFRFISWERAHPSVIALVYECLIRSGWTGSQEMNRSPEPMNCNGVCGIAACVSRIRSHGSSW